MIITLEQLKEKSSCPAGLDLFRQICPSGQTGEIEWTPAAQGFFLGTPLRIHFGWLVDAGLIPMWSLHEANLSYANLSCTDLSYANLSEANLNYADLRYANLGGADLSGANLFGADLSGANLFGADLSNANLFDADLSEANLYRADLSDIIYNNHTQFPIDFDQKQLSKYPDKTKGELNVSY